MNTSYRSSSRTASSASVALLLAATALPALGATTARPAPAPAPAARPATSASQGANGTLQWGQRQYYPQGCLHNGNHAICTFAFINNGELATINATPGGELWGTQFVDNGHVPHNFDNFYFVDQFNNHQNQLVVQRGDRGTLTLEFALVDPAVTYGEFHLRDQIVTGIAVNQPNYGGAPIQGGSAPQFAGAPQQPMQAQMPPVVTAANMPPATQQCVPGQGSMAVCNAMNSTSGALAQVAQVGGFFKALMPQKTSAAPVQQPMMPQSAPAQQPMTQQQIQQMQQQLQQQEAMLKLQQQQLQQH